LEDGGVLVVKKKTEEDDLVAFIGETISTESTLLACSINLMRAGEVAKATADCDGLLKVSKAWYDLARYLGGDTVEDKSNPIGFTTELETLDEPGDEPDAGEGGIEVRTKFRKL
jgi:hypothetical protein